MELDQIEKLVKLLENSSLNELTIKDGDFKISMSRNTAGTAVQTEPAVQKHADKEDMTVNITSPIVGTFYSASGPLIPAYVRTGDKVHAGDTVCIIEAMKMMNEIQADFDCEILAVLVSNEQKVEYGQPLFRVRKL